MLTALLMVSCKGNASEATKENLMGVEMPAIQKFVVVTDEEAPVYKEADTNSPTLVQWIEDIESDMADVQYQWSDEEVPVGYVTSLAYRYAGMACAVVGEKGDFYEISTLGEYCDIQTGYILKSATGDVEQQPLTAEVAEADDEWSITRVVKDGKYKGLTLCAIADELWGESMRIGVMLDGCIAYKYTVYNIEDEEVKKLTIVNEDGVVSLRYPASLARETEEDFTRTLDPNKLSDEQLGEIVDWVTTQMEQPDVIRYEYYFPALEGQTSAFWFKDAH